MYSQIILDKHPVMVLNVLTLNTETQMTYLTKARLESLRKYVADTKNAKTLENFTKAFNEHKERMKAETMKRAA